MALSNQKALGLPEAYRQVEGFLRNEKIKWRRGAKSFIHKEHMKHAQKLGRNWKVSPEAVQLCKLKVALWLLEKER